MVELKTIKQYQISRPEKWTVFGGPEDFDKLPDTHKEQIVFLNKEAEIYIYDFAKRVKLITGDISNPFEKNNFKSIEKYDRYINDEGTLKKWLYQRGIPFKTYVFLLPNYDTPIYTTWKIVVKYAPDIFSHNDILIFDQTLNWCLFYFHHNVLSFGKDNIYNTSADEKYMLELIKLKRQNPLVQFPY